MKRAHPEEEPANLPHKRTTPFWLNGLHETLKDPRERLFEDEKIVIIRDKFPKARFHFLVIPKESLDDLSDLNSSHVALLTHMIAQANSYAESQNITKNCTLRLGFHMVPSMKPLHMHMISQDFASVSLKTKKHWNSFTTEFFVDAEKILEELKSNGKVQAPDKEKAEQLLKGPLKCHVCKEVMSSIPRLKDHISRHPKK